MLFKIKMSLFKITAAINTILICFLYLNHFHYKKQLWQKKLVKLYAMFLSESFLRYFYRIRKWYSVSEIDYACLISCDNYHFATIHFL